MATDDTLYFLTYAADRVTTVRNPVQTVHTYVRKLPDGQWEGFLAVGYTRGPGNPEGAGATHWRQTDVRPTRTRAIEVLRGHLHDHFNRVPAMATLSIERGAPIPFPADSAHPYRGAPGTPENVAVVG